MKKNTGCNNSKTCPPAPHCDKAEPTSVSCEAKGYDVPPLTIDVPVVLSHVKLQANVEANINLPTPAREVKVIKKNVSLKQCEVIKHPYSLDKVKLYVTGVVHKNIQYVDACSGYVRDYSVDVPFTCSDDVKIYEYVEQLKSQKSSYTAEYKFLADDMHSSDRCKTGTYTFEFFNEPIECKLVYADVFELDLYKDFDRFNRFNKITEKMDINLWFKLLQTQERFRDKPPYPTETPMAEGFEDEDFADEPMTIMDRIKATFKDK